jgi:hypothetical protein
LIAPSCGSCLYGDLVIYTGHAEDCPAGHPAETVGPGLVCRRRPPTVIAGGATAWPAVEEADWCGDWKADTD